MKYSSNKWKKHHWIIVSLVLIISIFGINAFTPGGFLWKTSGARQDVTGKQESFTPWVWKNIEVRAVGDFIPHGSVLKTASHHKKFYDSLNFDGFRYLFEPVKHLFKKSHLNIVNFETPCSPSKFIKAKSYVFNAPASSIEALANMNFNLFVLANNHIYDKGRKGMLETIQQFKKRNLQYSGAGKTKNDVDIPVIKEINGVKIAVWSFTHFVNDDYNQKDSSWVSIFKEKDAVNKIKKWKDSVDVTIVTFHGGEEYKQKPLKKHIEAFHGMLDAGAMVIIGSHPHVPQPVEIYETKDGRETAIFYSLGNFMANQSRKYKHPVSSLEYGDTRDALVASFSLTLVDYGPLGKKWEVHNVGVIPCWIENNYNDVLRGKNGKKENKGENIIKRDIRVVSVYDEMDNIDMGLDTLLQKIEFKKANKIDSLNVKKLIKNKRHFLNRLKRIKKVVGDEFVKRPD